MMKNIVFLIFFLSNLITGQDNSMFNAKCSFKLSYSGWIKAGQATLKLKQDESKEFYHVEALGKTTGPIKWFFKVEDYYQSYFSKKSGLSQKFVRKINEGGHTKNLTIDFNQSANTATVNNLKKTTTDSVFRTLDIEIAIGFLSP